jgi:hypothetical protein
MDFEINIVQGNHGISCDLHKYGTHSFDMFLVIGDFVSTMKELINKRSDWDAIITAYDNHIFTSIPATYLRQRSIYYDDIYYNDIKNALSLVDKYLDMQAQSENGGPPDYIRFESMKNLYQSKFTYSVSLFDGFVADGIASYNKPLDDLAVAIDSLSCFTYTCHSITDMVAAILHYYLINKFKLIECKHCKRLFPSKTFKQKYCRRISPYRDEDSQKDSKPYDCEQTVRNAIQQQKRRAGRILKSIRQAAKYQTGEFSSYNAFIDRCDEFISTIRKEPSIENLLAYNEYLGTMTAKKRSKKKDRDPSKKRGRDE